ncbi:MAG: hypothetical protein ACTSWN_17420 [Promethearchaeota archaeon]
MITSFFKSFLIETAKTINNNFNLGFIIEVKHIRRVMNISSTNKSKIIFISRALQKLSDLGYLKYIGKNSPKRFKITCKIPIEKLETEI